MPTPNLRTLVGTPRTKVGTFLFEFATPGIGQILKAAGADFAVLDMEHTGFGFDTVRQVVRYLQAADLPSIVRVPSQSRHHISRALDAGADAIMVPIVSSVEQALTLYIETARPSVAQAQVFIRTRSPRVPISAPGIYDVVNRRLRSLGVQAAHLGPHALRHACASKMLADGLTLKEIGDHLGHRSAASTSIYAKVDLAGLRQVGEFDLGGLQ